MAVHMSKTSPQPGLPPVKRFGGGKNRIAGMPPSFILKAGAGSVMVSMVPHHTKALHGAWQKTDMPREISLLMYGRLLLITVILFTYLLSPATAQQPSPSLDTAKLEEALTTIDLFELNRFESALKELLKNKSSQQRSLFLLYLGKIYLREALYYESKTGESKSLQKTSATLANLARDQFKQLVRENRNLSDGYVYLAMAYAQKIRQVGYPTLLRYAKQVEENIEKALEKDPANPRAYLVQGIQNLYKPPQHGGGIDKAIPLLLKSVELDPSFHEGYYWLARAYVQNSFTGRNEVKARDFLKKALELSPRDYFYQQGLTPDVQVPVYKIEGKPSDKGEEEGE